jgi:hypothetical protein
MAEHQYRDEFEKYLKQQVDRYKMYPNDRIWGKLQDQLHGKGRWPQFSFTALILLVGISSGLLLLQRDETFNAPLAGNVGQSANSNNFVETLFDDQHSWNADFVASNQQTNKSTVEPVSTTNNIDNAVTYGEPIDNIAATTAAESLMANDELKDDNSTGYDLANDHINHFTIAQPVDLLAQQTDDDAQHFDNAGVEHKQTLSFFDPAQAQQMAENAPTNFANKTTIKIKQPNRWGVQIYAGSSVSYRQLSDNTERAKDPHSAAPIDNSYLLSINKLVNQKPSIGFEIGVAGVLNTSKRLKLRAGAQFNYRSYNIEAFTIAPRVNAPGQFAQVVIDPGYALNKTGDNMTAVELQNQFFEVSTPIGVEYLIAGNKNIKFSVAATVQPTILLNRDAFVISEDYKTYNEQPNVMRNFNLNTSLETFVSFRMGSVQLQAGPQVRYQVLSTYNNNFHLNEKLIDFGFKVGVVKSIF